MSDCKLGQPARRDACKWFRDDLGAYYTNCGEAFALSDRTIQSNGFVYCPFCGGKIIEQPADAGKGEKG